MPDQDEDFACGRDVPDAEGVVRASRNQMTTVGREYERVHVADMALEGEQAEATLRLVDPAQPRLVRLGGQKLARGDGGRGIVRLVGRLLEQERRGRVRIWLSARRYSCQSRRAFRRIPGEIMGPRTCVLLVRSPDNYENLLERVVERLEPFERGHRLVGEPFALRGVEARIGGEVFSFDDIGRFVIRPRSVRKPEDLDLPPASLRARAGGLRRSRSSSPPSPCATGSLVHRVLDLQSKDDGGAGKSDGEKRHAEGEA